MLTMMKVRNFTSFKDDTDIDVRSTGYKILEQSNVHNQVLKGLLFVGANASGKTNIIRGLRVLLELLFADKIMNLQSQKCLFSKEVSFMLEYKFEIEKQEINYVIEYDTRKRGFVAEKLKINEKEVVNRLGSTGESEITDTRLYTDIDPNALLLREIYFNTKFRSQPLLKVWFQFLLNSVYVDGHRRVIFSPGMYDLKLLDYLESTEGVNSINAFFERYNFDQRIEFTNSSSGNLTRIESGEEKRIFFKREGIGEPVPYSLESLGNQNLINLLPAFFHVIQNGGMLIIDEFSSGLHNFLEELLIRYFMKTSSNSQVFFVSHSTNLLSNALLRPDQIYAVDFLGMEGSKMKRISSEKPREAQNLEKMYTSGVFGGVPRYNDENNA